MMLLKQLDGLPDDEAAATGAGGRAARLDAHDAVVAGGDEILDAQLLGMKLHGRARRSRSGASRLVRVKVESCLGSQPICSTRLPSFEKADREIGGRRALADAALAIDGEDLGGPDLDVGVSSTCIEPSGWGFLIGMFICGLPFDAFQSIFEFFSRAS